MRTALLLLAAGLLAGCSLPSTAAAVTSTAPAPSQPALATSTQPAPSPGTATASSQPPTETAAPVPGGALPDPASYEWKLVTDGLRRPLDVQNAGDGSGRLFIVEQAGRILVYQDGAVLPQPFLDIVSEVGSTGNEQGLLGLAFHPDYAHNGQFYVNYTDLKGDTVIARFKVSADPNVGDAASESALLHVDQPFANHNGGVLAFGPDGYLYAGLGDGGSQGDPSGNGQRTDVLLGKILRLDVNSGDPYAIPSDNPFGNEVWAYGLRNPWRLSFDRATSDMYIGDVGQNSWEEIDFLPAGSPGGSNFGWNIMEGNHTYEGGDQSGLIAPVAEYSHAEGGCSVSGGHVYRGAELPEWQGVYLYGDFCSGIIWGLVQSEGSWKNQLMFRTNFSISSFGLDEASELYLTDLKGALHRLGKK